MAHRAKFTLKKQRAFFEALRRSGNVTVAADSVAVSRRTVYDHRAADPAFAALWEEAYEEAIDALEAEARRRAVDGVVVDHLDKDGKLLFTDTRYSDVLLIFLLKGARPEKYRDNVRTEHTGPGGGPIKVQPIDYRIAVAALAPGPVGDQPAPGQDQGAVDGAPLGEVDDG